MADDPFSIWGEPSTATTFNTNNNNASTTTKSSLDFFDSLAEPTSTSTSPSRIDQPQSSISSNKLFADDDATATWGQPPSPAPLPQPSTDQDLISQIDGMATQDRSQDGERSQSLMSEPIEDQRIAVASQGNTDHNQEAKTEVKAADQAKDKIVDETQEESPPISSADPSQIEAIAQNDYCNPKSNMGSKPREEDQEQSSPTSPQPPSTSAFISPPPAAPSNPIPPDDDFDDFDDFAESGKTGAGEHDDDFGDFGDFDDGSFPTEEPDSQREQVGVEPPILQQQKPTNDAGWSCLRVDADSTSESISAQIRELLAPPLSSGSIPYPYHDGSESLLGDDNLRQVEGNSQVLVSEKSRQAFSQLSQLPTLQPISWTRSFTRRSSLISLGVPINLDEVSTSSSGMGGRSTLPPLALTLDSTVPKQSGPNSAPASDGAKGPPKRSQSGLVPASHSSRTSTPNTPRTGSPAPNGSSSRNEERMAERRREELGLGPAPELDWKRAEEVVALTEDQLTLQSLPALRSISRELHALTTIASSLLTHHLTLRESHSADAEMYDSMIRDLVAGASNKLSSDKASSKGDRRATTIGLGASANKSRSASGAGMVHSNSQQRMNGGYSPRPSSPAVNSPKR